MAEEGEPVATPLRIVLPSERIARKTGETEASATAGALPDGFRATDVGNAERLIAAAEGQLRYVHAWQRWVVYTDGRWILDAGDALVTEVAKNVARRLFTAAIQESGDTREALWKWGKRCETGAAIALMIRLARAIPGVIVSHEQLDAKPWLFNCINGTIDLRTGSLRPHNPDDLLTKMAPVMFDATATAPLWEDCLGRWLPNQEVRGFLQRCTGSAITGHPVEALIVNVGTGSNGKTKFYGAISDVLGEYVVEPHKSLLVAQRHEQHATVIASLFGARMVVASETDDGDRLDETQVKNLTGGDRLRARRMREDEWSFRPSHTAFLHTNHRPRIRGNDEGIWRRVKIVPWEVTIPKPERDEHLAAKLAEEAPGILNWLIAGCLEWQKRGGIDDPAEVEAATGAYRADEDHIGRFLDDCTVEMGHWSVPAKELREAYETWCQEAGEPPWTPQAFGRALTSRGLENAKITGGKRAWKGIQLKEANDLLAGGVADSGGLSGSPHARGISQGYTEETPLSATNEQVYPSEPVEDEDETGLF